MLKIVVNVEIMNILVVYGTRPEAIKMAPVIHVLKASGLEVKVCVTAQHRELLDQVTDFFGITPDFDLDIMIPGQTLNGLFSRLIASLDIVLEKLCPDWVLVHGDTTTSVVGALAAFNRGIKVAHIEAGLRTYNKLSPFPEELNRQITSRIADIHFAPTDWAAANLLNEGVEKEQIVVTGNTVIDALFLGLTKLEQGQNNRQLEMVKELIRPGKKIILVTGHRRENFGDGFENICKALREISKNVEVQIIYPVHLNPNVQEPVNRILGNIDNIHLIEPLDYPAFIYVMNASYFIITDSGGVQEEAPSLGKPVLVVRNTTERPEAIKSGSVKLVGTSYENILHNVNRLIHSHELYHSMSEVKYPYGRGNASQKILETLLSTMKVVHQ